jgi:hypothetical protein
MKKILVSVVMLMLFLFASVCMATPFLVCDPPLAGDPVVTNYKLTGGSWVPASVPAMADGTIKLDLVNAPVGTNSMTVKACGVPDDVWEECSESVPFSFTRPPVRKLPKTLKLSR